MKISNIVFRLKNGFSLIEVLVALGVMSIAGMALMNMNVTSMKANKSNSIRQSIMDIKRTISTSLSCEETFKSLGPSRPISCIGPVALKDKNGNPLTNSNKIDDWTIEATCESLGSPGVNGLSIYATKPGKTDPLRSIPLDNNHPVSMLFSPELRMCREFFKPASSEGWVKPTFSSYSPSVFLTGTDGSVAEVRHGATSGVDSVSPTELCKLKGYDYASGNCRGSHSNTLRNFSYEGSLLSNNHYGFWGYACKYGDPMYFWADQNLEILCLRLPK
jgi:prepilin-type N-terminal cleavage/methylation domain-containing protein